MRRRSQRLWRAPHSRRRRQTGRRRPHHRLPSPRRQTRGRPRRGRPRRPRPRRPHAATRRRGCSALAAGADARPRHPMPPIHAEREAVETFSRCSTPPPAPRPSPPHRRRVGGRLQRGEAVPHEVRRGDALDVGRAAEAFSVGRVGHHVGQSVPTREAEARCQPHNGRVSSVPRAHIAGQRHNDHVEPRPNRSPSATAVVSVAAEAASSDARSDADAAAVPKLPASASCTAGTSAVRRRTDAPGAAAATSTGAAVARGRQRRARGERDVCQKGGEKVPESRRVPRIVGRPHEGEDHVGHSRRPGGAAFRRRRVGPRRPPPRVGAAADFHRPRREWGARRPPPATPVHAVSVAGAGAAKRTATTPPVVGEMCEPATADAGAAGLGTPQRQDSRGGATPPPPGVPAVVSPLRQLPPRERQLPPSRHRQQRKHVDRRRLSMPHEARHRNPHGCAHGGGSERRPFPSRPRENCRGRGGGKGVGSAPGGAGRAGWERALRREGIQHRLWYHHRRASAASPLGTAPRTA